MYTVKKTRKIGVQVGCPSADLKEKGVQCSYSKSSYGKEDKEKRHTTYEDLLHKYLWNKEYMISWLKDENLIATQRICGNCQSEMKWTECNDRSDEFVWECRKQIGHKRHRYQTSIREGSWFENANLTIEEVLKFTYWWCQDLKQWQIKQQLCIGSHTAVDWDMFCRELCEVSLFKNIGKRMYHRGHVVEGQWVFGGIEEESRKCFIATAENRTEDTLLKIIKEWIAPGSIIVSDCWKAYYNLDKHGYFHKTVNHSKEFVNEEGYDTNKIEGHWRQLKVKLPTHGRKKEHYSSYLAEFKWRYIHRGEDLWHVFLKDIKEVYELN